MVDGVVLYVFDDDGWIGDDDDQFVREMVCTNSWSSCRAKATNGHLKVRVDF